MHTERILVTHAEIDGIPVDVDYGDVFVVLRAAEDRTPEPTDWEAQLRTPGLHRVTQSLHQLTLTSPDGVVYRGEVITRFTDGRRHLFRGNGFLDGFERATGRP